ncbi:C40 family peptidase [Longicatena caecimuris]|uniref:NlpC/P60 family protein n=1 Tax=Longicatena caecimuris TaxID=1796635 RepID=UPI00210D3517|nr:NlpC/P60 family protein [Longicatena caecimuris]MCQ5271367.1 C40 family peptidase [Longicatena caecimuris]
MQYGDVIVWDGGSHVSIYIGGGQMVLAANPSMGVIVSGVSEWASYGQSITGIRRV